MILNVKNTKKTLSGFHCRNRCNFWNKTIHCSLATTLCFSRIKCQFCRRRSRPLLLRTSLSQPASGSGERWVVRGRRESISRQQTPRLKRLSGHTRRRISFTCDLTPGGTSSVSGQLSETTSTVAGPSPKGDVFVTNKSSPTPTSSPGYGGDSPKSPAKNLTTAQQTGDQQPGSYCPHRADWGDSEQPHKPHGRNVTGRR